LKKIVLLLFVIVFSCSKGNLIVTADLPSILSEASALQMTRTSNDLWIIEDAGNTNTLYAIDSLGKLTKEITIENAKNKDWEDLTTDSIGNIYIGDFGNNSKKRNKFTILKIEKDSIKRKTAIAKFINFKLPKTTKSKDFEGFFLHQGFFYIFSKEHKKFITLKVPNEIGTHTATIISEYKFEGNQNRITGADISPDGKTVVLLNHEKLWKLTNFKANQFFSGKVESIPFNNSSQKEGICFKSNSEVYIADETTKNEGGNLYRFNLN
jgi:hypothetical protein